MPVQAIVRIIDDAHGTSPAPETLGRATGKVPWPLRPASVKARPAASRSLIRAHPQMEGEPLMPSESTGEARASLAAFPGLANVTVIEHGAGIDGRPGQGAHRRGDGPSARPAG
jgi:hypothetical protein